MTRSRLVLALGVACAAALWLGWSLAKGSSRPEEHATPRPARSVAAEVSGFEARLDGPLEVRVRLAPLHADPELQTFDAGALRRRLALGEGAPYALDVELAAQPTPVASAGAKGASSAAAHALILDTSTLRVVDDEGVALVPIVMEPQPADSSVPADPVRALFAARTVVVDPAGWTRVVLWGRAPAKGARVAGWPARDVALVAQTWRADAFEDVLARSPGPRADDEDVQTSDAQPKTLEVGR